MYNGVAKRQSMCFIYSYSRYDWRAKCYHSATTQIDANAAMISENANHSASWMRAVVIFARFSTIGRKANI